MSDFDVTLGKEWLHFYYATFYCRHGVIIVQFPNGPFLEYKGCTSRSIGQFVSYIRPKNDF